ncbi:MAG TPA: hypothetical protein VHX14_09545 [Thermoanaerobaculia bacterium]|jgi:uncharacterized membrane protein|nr:hypothetical protein [Thermoanaerobaculia bacterium]
MDRAVLIITVALGTLLAITYCIRCGLARAKIELGVIVTILIHSFGVVAGFVILGSAVYEPLRRKIADPELYIFISGVAVVVVSVQALFKDVFKASGFASPTPPAAPPQPPTDS